MGGITALPNSHIDQACKHTHTHNTHTHTHTHTHTNKPTYMYIHLIPVLQSFHCFILRWKALLCLETFFKYKYEIMILFTYAKQTNKQTKTKIEKETYTLSSTRATSPSGLRKAMASRFSSVWLTLSSARLEPGGINLLHSEIKERQWSS